MVTHTGHGMAVGTAVSQPVMAVDIGPSKRMGTWGRGAPTELLKHHLSLDLPADRGGRVVARVLVEPVFECIRDILLLELVQPFQHRCIGHGHCVTAASSC